MTVTKGALYVLSRLIVAKICNVNEAAADLDVTPANLWEANEHIVATEPYPIYFDRVLPLEVTERLKFLTEKGAKLLTFVEPGCLDRQTLRGVRELKPGSAVKLDTFLSISHVMQ